MTLDWSITGGDILQLAGFLLAAGIFVMRLDKQIGIMKAQHDALKERVDNLEKGIRDDIREIKDTLNAVFSKLDKKADKEGR